MNALLERLRRALASDYDVERELASGGMGIVFLGRDRALDRPVAIKTLHPALATAVATERFLREARVLARLNHPNVMPVHRAGEADGIPFYVMDYFAAPTLADRLSERACTAAEVARLGADLLTALETVHAAGLVHRDIKPSNVFLLDDGRALLADFGIAKSVSGEQGDALTAPGHFLGTPGYMPPEQVSGNPVTPQSDLCAVGMVLFEALTRRRWDFETAASPDWSGVPRPLVPVLSRALAWKPADRWPDAAAFRRALARATARRPAAGWLTALTIVAAAVLALWPPPVVSTDRTIAVRPLVVEGAGAAWLGDSLAAALPAALGDSPDFTAVFAPRGEASRAALVLGGRVRLDGASFAVEIRRADSLGAPPLAEARGDTASWRGAVEGLALGLLQSLWRREGSPLAADLPLDALPATAAGYAAWLRAERHLAQGSWLLADTAYALAVGIDSTCLLCEFRREDVSRWMRRAHAPERVRRYVTAADRFSPAYRAVIEASVAPAAERWDRLRRATEQAPNFHLAHFVAADELYHRGPLAGRLRRDALPLFQRAAQLRPDFAPGWEHLAALAIGEGERAVAESALTRYLGFGERLLRDPVSFELAALARVAFAWRFLPDGAPALTDAVLGAPEMALAPDVAAGPAYLLAFDVPEAVVHVGEAFARGHPRPDLVERGYLARIHGLLALGRPGAARAAAEALLARTTDPELRMYLAQLPAALALADSTLRVGDWREVAAPLDQLLGDPATITPHRRRAAWMSALVARRAGDEATSRRLRARLDADPAAAPFARFLAADATASAGRPAAALALSDTLLALDSASSARVGDPFFRALLHLTRAEWLRDTGRLERAVAALRWHENADYVSFSLSLVQSAEVDWALGTLARWRRTELLERLGRRQFEICWRLSDVARLWREAEPPWRALADRARARLAALDCGAS